MYAALVSKQDALPSCMSVLGNGIKKAQGYVLRFLIGNECLNLMKCVVYCPVQRPILCVQISGTMTGLGSE